MFFRKKIVGIDIGVGSIKVVEISKLGSKKKLENYGELKTDFLGQTSGKNFLPNNLAAEAIKAILDETKIKTKEVIFSIPDFSSFCTSFDMPQMTAEEIPGAVQYNASQYITLPISEVTLDWQVMQKNPADKNSSLRVFLVAIPKKMIEDYQVIAKLAGLELYALEAESFGITRALVKDDKKIICLIDIGAETSTINIVDKGYLRGSYSSNFSGNKITNSLVSILKIDKSKAEEIKIKEGILASNIEVNNNINSLVDPFLSEIKFICDEFLQKENKEIQEIYLSGGTANLPGLKEYFKEKLKKEITIPDCFLDISYPPTLKKTLSEIGPSFSAAVGVALFRLNK